MFAPPAVDVVGAVADSGVRRMFPSCGIPPPVTPGYRWFVPRGAWPPSVPGDCSRAGDEPGDRFSAVLKLGKRLRGM